MAGEILIDKRVGSFDLVKYITPKSLVDGTKQLPFGDMAFEGNGPKGRVRIGIERKRMSTGDALSSITTGRFAAHQLEGMWERYDVYWLLLEGRYRAEYQTGTLQIQKKNKKGEYFWTEAGGGRWSRSAFDRWWISINMQSGIQVWNTATPEDTALWVTDLYWEWQKKWSEHSSLKVFHKSSMPTLLSWNQKKSPKMQRAKVIKELCQGIGWDKAVAAADYFPTLKEAFCAPCDEWAEIKGFGKELSRRVTEAINGKEKTATGTSPRELRSKSQQRGTTA